MKYNVLQYAELVLKKYGISCLLSSFALFCMGSIATFSSTDASWFYHASQVQSYKNMFGFFGSNCAAWLIYFFGSAAFLFSPVFLYCVACYFFIFVIKKTQVIFEWDRTVGVVVGFLTTTIFCQIYHFTSYDFTYSGGVVGNYLVKHLLVSFDSISQKVIVWALLLFSIILVTRCSYIPLFKNMSKFLHYVFNPEKLPARIITQVYSMITFVIACVS